MPTTCDRLVIIALTQAGLAVAARLASALPGATIFCPTRIAYAGAHVQRFDGRLANLLQKLVYEYDGLVLVMALGIVVRLLGPLARDKGRDPAVVVVDEAGKFAVSVLGGHRGGANDLTRRVAEILGATPVITTASDVLGLPAVDLIGQEFGWKLENEADLTAVAAAVVNGRPIAVFQDSGQRDWWKSFGEWPEHFQWVSEPTQTSDRFAALLVISDRRLTDELKRHALPYVVYRPATLCVGVGCRRGVTVAEIQQLFDRVFDERRLSPASIAAVASAWLKADEPALVEFAARLDVPLRTFSWGELSTVSPLPTPSEQVFAQIGLHGVAEPAAMLAAHTRDLIVPKQASQSVTIAVARERPE